MVYELNEADLRILSLRALDNTALRKLAPTAVEDAMLDQLKSPEFDERRPKIILEVGERQVSRQIHLRDKHGFKHSRTEKVSGGDDNAIYVMECATPKACRGSMRFHLREDRPAWEFKLNGSY